MLINLALLKYNKKNFTCLTNNFVRQRGYLILFLKDVINREQYYLDTLNPVYNNLKTAGSYFGYTHNEASLLKISLRTI